jgi:cytidine deaminase
MASSVQISSMNSRRWGAAYIAPRRVSLAGADGMEGGYRADTQPFEERCDGLDRRPLRTFAAARGIERLLRDDLARYADAGDHDASVKFGVQVVRPDSRRRRRIGRAQDAALPHASRHSGGRSRGQSARISISALERKHHPPPSRRCHRGGSTKTSPERRPLSSWLPAKTSAFPVQVVSIALDAQILRRAPGNLGFALHVDRGTAGPQSSCLVVGGFFGAAPSGASLVSTRLSKNLKCCVSCCACARQLAYCRGGWAGAISVPVIIHFPDVTRHATGRQQSMSDPERAFHRIVPVSALEPSDQQLCQEAAKVAPNAYAPYSRFFVGAAVRTARGVYVGANLENASYGIGICAEVSAVTAANSAGDFNICAIAVMGYPSDDPARGIDIITPCGRCRQIIFEASQVSATDIQVISCNGDLSKCKVSSASELLPDSFGPANLGIDVNTHRKK